MKAFRHALGTLDPFSLRRAMERLREGLFDPIAVSLLTAHRDELLSAAVHGLEPDPEGSTPHLCVCGAYGQGKSHTLHLVRERAHALGFATSMINLDPREVPFHEPRYIYRAILSALRFPEPGSLITFWKAYAREHEDTPAMELLPEPMPHLFRCTLAALAQPNRALTRKQLRARAHKNFRPRIFPYQLRRALYGETVSLTKLRNALKYRDVPGYTSRALSLGHQAHLEMLHALARLIQQMGFAGLVLLFDEGESLMQLRAPSRRKAYHLIEAFLHPQWDTPALFSLFAFTPDFFQGLEEDEAILGQDDWKQLVLQDLDADDLSKLHPKLLELHAHVYRWSPHSEAVLAALRARLERTRTTETRLRLRALIDELDIQQQKVLFGDG